MRKVYFLKTCDTCKRIMSEVNLEGFEQQEIKSNPINEDQLSFLFEKTNSYEGLFNKRARLYKERELKNAGLKEEDYKKLILEEYTFLKRPVFIVEDDVFVGNSKKVVEALKERLA